jgi:galactokinase
MHDEIVRKGLESGDLLPRTETVVARAPGRLDVMGGIADYSGSLVLQLPTAEATWVAVQATSEPWVDISSGGRQVRLECSLFSSSNVTYAGARRFWAGVKSDRAWVAYVAGVITALAVERNAPLVSGLRIFIDSRVPEGKGVSSSAAIEVATMRAMAELMNVELDGVELATLCQKVENLVVGAPCGIMDQMTSACGQENRLLALRCQPAEVLGHVALPEGLAVWGVDSGIRHAVSGADYGTVRAAAFMGYRILRHHVGGDRWEGYLANVTPSELAAHVADLPDSMTGRGFTETYGDHGDALTRIDADHAYPVRAATAHPVGEHHRIRCFAHVVKSAERLTPLELETLSLLGEMMYQSHASYSACGLGSDGTDRLVALVREAGPVSGLFGAKITGGGSGGTVAILGRSDAGDAVRDVAQRYAAETGRGGYIFEGSSPGAMASPVQRITV